MRNFIHLGQAGWRLLAVAVASVLGMGSAYADCSTLTFNSIPSTVSWVGGTGNGYNPFDASDRVQSVTVTIRKTGGTCSFVIGATTGGGDTFTTRVLNGSGNTLPFNLYTTSTRTNVIKDLPNATTSDLIVGSFTSNGTSTKTVTYFYDIAPQQIVAPASYSRSMQIKLYEVNGSTVSLSQTANVNHTATVNTLAELSLIASGGAFDSGSTTQSLNLGSMATAQNVGFDMRVRGNTGFDIQLNSQNRGVLKHSDSSVTDTVPYVMKVNGATMNLSGGGGATFDGPSTKTGITGNVFPVEISVGAQTGTAGTYTDVISVSVISN